MKTNKIFYFLTAVLFLMFFNSCKEKYNFQKIKDLRSDFSQIAFSSDGKYIAKGYFTLKILKSIEDTTPVKVFTDFKDIIKEIKFSPQNKYLAVGFDSSIFLYSVEKDFSLLKKISGKKFSFSNDDGLLAATIGKKITIYKTSDFSIQKELDLGKDVIKAQFSKDGKYLFAADSNKIYVYTLPDYEELKGLKFYKYKITDFDLSSDNQTIAISFKDKIYIYTFKSDKFSFKTQVASFFTKIKAVRYSPAGNYLFVKEETYSETPKEQLSIYKIENNKKYILQSFIKVGTLYDLSFINKDNFAIVWPQGIDLYKLDFENATEKFLPFTKIFYEILFGMGYNPDGRIEGFFEIHSEQPNFLDDYIIFNRATQTLFLPTEKKLYCYRYYYSRFNYYCSINSANAFALFHTKKYIAVANDSLKRIEIYKLGFTPKLVSYFSFPNYTPATYVRNMKISKDDRLLFVQNDLETIVIDMSDLQNMEIIRTYYDPNFKLTKNYFIKNHQIYSINNLDSSYYYVDSLTGYNLSFSPDEKYLIGSYYEKTKIWKLEDDALTLVKTIENTKFAFTEDSKYFIDVEDDENIANIFKSNNLDYPIKKIKLKGKIYKIFTSGPYLAINYSPYEWDEDIYQLAIYDTKRNFKFIDTISLPYPEKFISAGYGKAFFIITEQELGDVNYKNYAFYLKTKMLKPYKSIVKEPWPEFIFTKSGKYLLTKEVNLQKNYTKISVLDFPSFETVNSLTLKNKKIAQIYISPKNSFITFFSDRNSLDIYSNDKNFKKLKEIPNVDLAIFSNNEKYLALIDTSLNIEIFDTKNFKLKKRLYPNQDFNLLKFSDNDKYLIVYSSFSNTGELYNVRKDFSLKGEIEEPFYAKFFDDDQKVIIMSYLDKDIKICKITSKGIKTLNTLYPENLFEVNIYPLGKDKLVMTTNTELKIFDIKKEFSVIFRSKEPKYFKIAIDRDNKFILTFSSDYKILNIYSVKDNFELIFSLNDYISNVVFSPDNKLAFAFGKEKLYILSVDNDFEILKTITPQAYIDNVIISPDTKYFIVKTEYGPMIYSL